MSNSLWVLLPKIFQCVITSWHHNMTHTNTKTTATAGHICTKCKEDANRKYPISDTSGHLQKDMTVLSKKEKEHESGL